MTAAKRLLVVEDGDEYCEFARLFLGDVFEVEGARSAKEALGLADARAPDALLIDLRFDRTPIETLVGDVEGTAARLFGGEHSRALRYLQDNQGTLVLGELRKVGIQAVAVFVHDFSPRRLLNLQRLYGAVRAVPSFDRRLLKAALLDPAPVGEAK